ncbi:MAG: DUF4040 domain-containing protein [Gammaproteobacteria bacterium TMED1]|nr:MAG: DUF4040 domain-containing protein [Gammaproteobacteria bacterium TMED1]|tara:strand:+ start:1597 stop:2121 length:525 start_codon:yes stop_codon:yes gene_type:complete
MLAVTAIALLCVRGLFVASMLTGIYSLLTTALFVLLDAVDVAFTEAAVGAGITTVLFLAMLSKVSARHNDSSTLNFQPLPFLVVILTGALLVYATRDMPEFGDPQAPANLHVAPKYIKDGKKETGVPNLVTAVLASYRGYDTLGEVTVIFTAGVGVLLLLGRKRRRTSGESGEE